MRKKDFEDNFKRFSTHRDGNCGFHAIYGSKLLLNGDIYFVNQQEKRNKLVSIIRRYRENSEEVIKLIRAGVRNVFRNGSSLADKYPNLKIVQHRVIRLCARKKEEENKKDYLSQEVVDSIVKEINSLQEDVNISDTHLREYADLVSESDMYLLASDLGIPACYEDFKLIVCVNDEAGFMRSTTYNESSDKVEIIYHNGIDHFEKVVRRSDSKAYFQVDQGSSGRSDCRKYNDHDGKLSAKRIKGQRVKKTSGEARFNDIYDWKSSEDADGSKSSKRISNEG